MENLADVVRELEYFSQWKHLGLNLGLHLDFIDRVAEDNRLIHDRLIKVLHHWLTRSYDVEEYGLPTWSALANAVEPINRALAMAIKEKYV